jgi:hypothetical protein
MNWLSGGRKGEVADGGMIIKEMFYPPVALYYEPTFREPQLKDPKTRASLFDSLMLGWTVMVKDRSVAKGGWFYSDVDVSEDLGEYFISAGHRPPRRHLQLGGMGGGMAAQAPTREPNPEFCCNMGTIRPAGILARLNISPTWEHVLAFTIGQPSQGRDAAKSGRRLFMCRASAVTKLCPCRVRSLHRSWQSRRLHLCCRRCDQVTYWFGGHVP